MLPDAHLAELRRALEALSEVIAARLEDGAGAEKSDELPPRSVFEGDGPLGGIVADCGLSAAEALVLVAAIAPEADPRYAALYGLLGSRFGGSAALTGEVACTLAGGSLAARMRAADLLSPAARLRALKLVRLEASDDGALAGRLRPDPDLVAWVLGRAREVPTGSHEFPAVPLRTVHRFSDVIVPGRVREELRDLLARIRHRRHVTLEWGFAAHHDNVSGIVALFHGPSGTGKTLAAAVVAREVGLPAYVVDLSSLVSKYIGETEKNLARIFDVAEREDCILAFDEADAVFSRRGEIHEARDVYPNQLVAFLLQRIEAHSGVVILTTNFLANIDEAFQRRIDVVISFPEPTLSERLALWRSVVPPELPLDATIDLAGLAERFELTGAQIRDATLEAAYLAADDGRVVTSTHLEAGIRRQYAKTGRMLPAG
jgi:hypothetical protein